jgi:hypothetical protein
MRRVRRFAAVTLLLLGCGAPRPPLAPYDPAAEERARFADGAKLVAAAKPALDVRVLSDDEVVAALGARTARRVLTEHVVLRAEVVARGFEVGGVSLVLEGEGGKVPIVARDAESFAVRLTGEHYPAPHEWTEWHMADIPYPKVEGLLSFAAASLEVAVVGPVQLLTLHSEKHTRPPTDAEVRVAVPNTAKLLDKAAPVRSGDGVAQLVFAARPAQPDAALRVHAAVELRHAGKVLGLRAAAPLSPGPAIEGRAAHVELAGGELAPRAFASPVDETCPEAEARRFDQRDGACPTVALAPPRLVTLGLELPPVPAALGTAAASRKAKPSWAGDGDAPSTAPLGVAEAAADEDVELVACTADIPKGTYAVASIGGKRILRLSSPASFPFVRLRPRGTFSVAIFERNLILADDLLVTATFQRSGASLTKSLSPKRSRRDVRCAA